MPLTPDQLPAEVSPEAEARRRLGGLFGILESRFTARKPRLMKRARAPKIESGWGRSGLAGRDVLEAVDQARAELEAEKSQLLNQTISDIMSEIEAKANKELAERQFEWQKSQTTKPKPFFGLFG